MKQTINFYDFERAFKDLRPDNFSYAGLRVLYDYMIDYEESCGEEWELDVIGLCCDFNESELDEIITDYSVDISDCEDQSERLTTVLDYLIENTSYVGETDTTIIYGAF